MPRQEKENKERASNADFGALLSVSIKRKRDFLFLCDGWSLTQEVRLAPQWEPFMVSSTCWEDWESLQSLYV